MPENTSTNDDSTGKIYSTKDRAVKNFKLNSEIVNSFLFDPSILDETELNSALLNSIFETSNEVFVFITKNYKIKAFNKAAQKHSSALFNRDIKIADSILDYITDEEKGDFIKNFQDALNKETIEEVKKVEGFENRVLWMNFSFTPVVSSGDKVIGVLYRITDLTERRKNSSEFYQSYSKYQLVVENVNDAIVISQKDKFIFFNGRFAEMLGYSSEELIEKDFREIFSPEGVELLYERQRKRDAGEHVASKYETSLITKSGQRIEVEANVRIIIYTGQLATFAVIRDITERKEAEKHLKRSEEKYRSLFESFRDIYFRTDKNGLIREISPSVSRQSGYKAEDLIGRPVADFCFEEIDRKILFKEILRKEIVDGYELSLKGKNGEKIFASLSAKIITDEEGRLKGIEGVIHDISYRMKQEDELIRLSRELASVKEKKEKLYSIIAYDLRNPFSSILGYADLLSQNFDDLSNTEKKVYIKSICRFAKNIETLLENLQIWADIESGKIEFSPQRIDLLSLVNRVFGSFEQAAIGKEISLRTDIQDCQNVYSDEKMLLFVLNNLISNGIKFTQSGGEVVVACKNFEDRFLEISVTDTGVGMSQHEVSNLFNVDTYFSKPGTMEEEGYGMGLIISKRFIEENAGRIEVESELGKGSKFRIIIPVK